MYSKTSLTGAFLWFFFLAKKGSITLGDLQKSCEEAGIRFTERELEEMMEEADINGDGHVDQSEFIRIMLQTNLF
jgi:Ca2+-binding EF-hand superfamily protein